MEYGGYNVTEKYSNIVEPNLYYDSIFQPGMTYTDKFQGDAASGLVKIFKVGADGVQEMCIRDRITGWALLYNQKTNTIERW